MIGRLRCSGYLLPRAAPWKLDGRRSYSSHVPGDASDLPLKGYKVLDMTRVLAGVRLVQRSTPVCSLYSDRRTEATIAVLHSNTGRLGVSLVRGLHRALLSGHAVILLTVTLTGQRSSR
jgi:hypothetical protein